jgi:cation-transporting ATPase F
MHHLIGENWHSLDEKRVVELFESDSDQGLSPLSIKHKKEFFGLNEIKQKQKDSKLKKFFMQFHDALIYILLGAAITTAFLHEWVDSGVIFGVVIINVIVGFIQEVKAEEAIESLKNLIDTEAVVIRDGKKIDISSKELVPGDIVLLESGFKIPADLRLLEVNDLRVDESMLTGESLPIQKELHSLDENTTLNDRKNSLYSGTYVTYGRGKGIVVATGEHTEIGKIAHLIDETTSLQTPLTRKIAEFSKTLLYIILGLAIVTFGIGLLRDYSVIDMFMASVALAVGAIPEGLPAAVTITLAIGVHKMATKNAIIRKLPAVETLGSVTTICSDKTGTLTQNKMTVTHIYTGDKTYEVSGTGYEPTGGFSYESKTLDVIPDELHQTLKSGYLCNESYLLEKEGEYEIKGDPTEGAMIVSALKSSIDEYHMNEDHKRLDILPFESDRQYMATLNTTSRGVNELHLKGSIEKVLIKCSHMLKEKEIVDIDIASIEKRAEELALLGLRVLAVAKKEHLDSEISDASFSDDFVFLGLQAMIDPPRPEAIEAVRESHGAGINVIMITGDHAVTAFSISKMMGIIPQAALYEESVLRGSDILKLSDEEIIEKVKTVNVFARVEPEQKLIIVDALQARGEIVAMTGDGVNDAPALKQADIGIAMGKGGTEVAKEASDMILTDDNFSSIAKAIKEGRGVYDNLIKFITWTLPTNLGEGLVILFAIMLGLTLPILPVQILWINMSTAILLGLMLVFEAKENNIMSRPPRDPRTPILSKELVIQMLVVGFYMLIASYMMFNQALEEGRSDEYARTIAVNIFVFVELFYLFSCKNLNRSVFRTNPFDNRFMLYGITLMVLAQLAFTHSPTMNVMFKSQPLDINSWISVLVVSFGVVFVVEVLRKVRAIQKGVAYE